MFSESGLAESVKVCRGGCSQGMFYSCEWTTCFGSGSVFTQDPDCLRLHVTAKGWDEGLGQSYQGWICNFFAASFCWEKERAVTQVVEVTTVLGIFSRSLQPVCRGQWLGSHRFENRRGLSQRWNLTGVSKIKEKSVWLQELCLFCCGGILTWVTFVSSNREDFQSVILWCMKVDRAATAEEILVYFSSHSGYVAVQWMCNTLRMVAVFIKYTDGVNPGKRHYLLWSSLIKYQSQC